MGCRLATLVVAGVDMPHQIELAIVFMNWLITFHCFDLFLIFTNMCYHSIEVVMYYHVKVEIRDQ